jgi:membrane protease YdiL (CAAX protease family)
MAAFEGGQLPWAAWLTPGAEGLYHSPAERGWGVLTTGALVRRIALNAVVGVIAVAVLAFFEEIGWRAWLLPRLAERFGARRAVVATAVIAALWHTPYALSGIHHFEGIDAVTVALFAPIGHIAAALVIGWLWLRTESIWIVCLAHGALNNWGQYAFKYMDGPTSGKDGVVLLVGLLVLLLVGSVLLAVAPGKRVGVRPTAVANAI